MSIELILVNIWSPKELSILWNMYKK